jgi:esterase/lipase superfamily enzyme
MALPFANTLRNRLMRKSWLSLLCAVVGFAAATFFLEHPQQVRAEVGKLGVYSRIGVAGDVYDVVLASTSRSLMRQR